MHGNGREGTGDPTAIFGATWHPPGLRHARLHAAVALREALRDAGDVLSPAERGLLEEWLERLSA